MTLTLPPATRRTRDLVAPALEAALARLSPQMAQVAGYHLGLVDPDGQPAGGGGGKAVRPTLALLGAEAVGAAPSVAVPGAVAVELVHNFSLLHDDVMDGDTERRHRPTAWTVFGTGSAVLAGDALLTLALQLLLEPATPSGVRAVRRLTDATAALIVGQDADLAFEQRATVGVDECLAMCAGKTAALLSCAASIGAVLGDADGPAVTALARFGHELGIAFQAIDDLLGIWGRPEATGKPAWSDLRQRKKSLPVAAALAADGAAAQRLGALLARRQLDDRDVGLAAALIEECGGREWTVREAARRLERALAALDGADLDPAACTELDALARFVTDREM